MKLCCQLKHVDPSVNLFVSSVCVLIITSVFKTEFSMTKCFLKIFKLINSNIKKKFDIRAQTSVVFRIKFYCVRISSTVYRTKYIGDDGTRFLNLSKTKCLNEEDSLFYWRCS